MGRDKRSSIALYEHAAAVLARVDEGAGIRTTLYQHTMPNAFRPTVLALVSETAKQKESLEAALSKVGIQFAPGAGRWLAGSGRREA